MKNTIVLIAALVLFVPSQASAMHVIYAPALLSASAAGQPSPPAQEGGFEASPEWAKLTEPVQAAWLVAKDSGDMQQRIECFVRVRAPFDMGDADFLQSNGFNVITTGGNIVRGHVAAADMQAVARLPFVDKINLATKK